MKCNQLLLFLCCICCFIFILVQPALTEWTAQDEQNLIRDKFLTDAAATESMVMVKPPGSKITKKGLEVQLGYSQIKIHEVDDSNGYITISMREELSWIDSRLAWDASNYSHVEKIHILAKYIWLPDISFESPNMGAVVATSDHHVKGTKAVMTSHGGVNYSPTRTARFYCRMDVTLFPYDQQICKVSIGAWVHAPSEMAIILKNEGLIESQFDTGHVGWTLESSTLSIDTNDVDQTVELIIHIVRKSDFFRYTLLVPCIAINFILPFLHFIPSGSSQKTTLAGLLLICSMILHFMVFLQLRGSSEDTDPVIVELFDIHLVMIASSVMVSSVTSAISSVKHTSWRVPLFLRLVMSKVFDKICLFGRNEGKEEFSRLEEFGSTIDLVQREISAVTDGTSSQSETYLQQLVGGMRAVRVGRQIEKEWFQLALIVDRCTGIVYFFYALGIAVKYEAKFTSDY